LRTTSLVLAVLLSAFIVVDIVSSWFGVFSETSSNAKIFLFVLALVMAGPSVLGLFDLWTGRLPLILVVLAAATTLISWYATTKGTEAAKEAIHAEEKRSTASSDQMRAVENNLRTNN